jgi:hypothetical protein
MKSSLRYQEGHLYEHHGAWYVRYRRKVRHEDGSSTWKRTARRLGRSCDFTNSFDVRRCRAELMLVALERADRNLYQLRFEFAQT